MISLECLRMRTNTLVFVATTVRVGVHSWGASPLFGGRSDLQPHNHRCKDDSDALHHDISGRGRQKLVHRFDLRPIDSRCSSNSRRSPHPCSSTSHSSMPHHNTRNKGRHPRHWREHVSPSGVAALRGRWMQTSWLKARPSSCFRVNSLDPAVT